MKNVLQFNRLSIMAIFLAMMVSCEKAEQDLLAQETQKVTQTEVKQDTEANEDLDGTMEMETLEPVTTTFNITISNVINYLNALVFNTPNGAQQAGPIPDPGCFYSIDFKAVPGTKLSFATMSVVSNDWFFAPSGTGIPLFNDGIPVTGDVTEYVHLWDAGVEEEDPDTFTSAPGGAEAGMPDDDNTVRIVETNVTSLIQARLGYDEGTKYFTLKIFNIRGASAASDPIIITPGIVVLHAQDNALFTEGNPDNGLGLAKIAVLGNPSDLYGWFTETCSSGVPLRLSSSFTVFSPGIVYAFDSESDPVFRQGEPMMPGSGIEDLAEDGNNAVIFDFITDQLNLPAAKSDEVMPIGPGGSLSFTLEVPEGYKLGFTTMFAFSNDWFLAHSNTGHSLFNEDGSAKAAMDITENTYLFDAGTEVDQPVGFGPDQAPFQSGPNMGASDQNNLIRRVMAIDDVQFGKGLITSGPGVVGLGDLRGGYNIAKVTVTPY